jgi:hypothetical protein
MFPIRNAVPSRYPPVITWTLIAINVLFLLIENSLDPLDLEEFLSFVCGYSGALFLSGWAWCRSFACRLRSFLHDDVPARRLAASHTQHVDAVALRIDGRGPAWARALPRFLYCLRGGCRRGARLIQSDVTGSGLGSIRRNCRRARVLYAPFPPRAGHRSGTNHIHSALLRNFTPSCLWVSGFCFRSCREPPSCSCPAPVVEWRGGLM